MRFRFTLALGLLAPLWSADALGDIRVPDCGELIAWAREVDFKTDQKVNPFKTYAWLEDFLGPKMVALYGKSAADFTAAEAEEAEAAAKACGKTADKADRKLLAGVEKQFARVVGPIAANREEALAELGPALEAFAATPAGADKLRMIAAMRASAAGDRGAVTAAASGISREAAKVLDGVLGPMQLLPLDLAAARVMPVAVEAEPASLDALVEEIRGQYAALEANERTLQRWDDLVARIERPVTALMTAEIAPRLGELAAARRAGIEAELTGAEIARLAAVGEGPAAIVEIDRIAGGNLMRQLSPEGAQTFRSDLAARRQTLALALIADSPIGPETLAKLPQLEAALTRAPDGLVSEADQTAIRAAIEARRAEAAVTVAAQLQAAIAATPVETGSFATLDRLLDARILAQLAPADADAVLAAARDRRDALGEALSALLREELDGLDEDERSLAIIDTALLPGTTAIPASAGPWREALLSAVVERRNAILADITHEQRGSLEDRVYVTRDGSVKVEFRDDDEAYVTDGSGQTQAVAYEEVGDEQVKLALPQATIVLTREGRWLVGGPLQLQRIDDAK